jgi:hypothetical protein
LLLAALNEVNPSKLEEKISPSIQGGLSPGNCFAQRRCSRRAAPR